MKSKRGGARAGAGRPALPPEQRKQGVSMMLKPATIVAIKSKFGTIAAFAASLDDTYDT